MEGVLDMRAEVGVEKSIVALEEEVELGELRRDADRADRVPHAEAFDRDALVAPVEALQYVGILVPFLVALPQFQEAVEILLAEQPRIADQPADAACRVGAARKAEQEDLVALAIVAADERVGIAQVLRQAEAERAARDLAGEIALRADARLIEHDLRDVLSAALIDLLDRPGEARDIGVAGAVVRVVPRPVAAHHKPLHRHQCLPSSIFPHYQR